MTNVGVSAPLVRPDRLREELEGTNPPVVLDVRTAGEFASGTLPQALHLPLALLEGRAEAVLARHRAVVCCCTSGRRSLGAATTLLRLGYANVRSLNGGLEGWRAAGFPIEGSTTLGGDEGRRYARQLVLPEVGPEGQRRLRRARVLVVGVGGLGSPAALYLASAGVGTLGLVDPDTVDLSNLHRQVLYRADDVGTSKLEAAERFLTAVNPELSLQCFPVAFAAPTAERILSSGWDVVVDGTDRIAARSAINEACARAGIPVVYGAIHRFEGQIAVFHPAAGHPCYRCLFPVAPLGEVTPSCAEAGVVGILPGVVGSLQAMEVFKLILGIGAPLFGRLLRYSADAVEFETLRFGRDPECPTCAREGCDSGSFPCGDLALGA